MIPQINNKLNQLSFSLKKVKKCLPKKRIPETNAIFEEVKKINEKADKEDGVLRISLDLKAAVKVGKFSRGGKNRQEQKALDHDFQPEATIHSLCIQSGNEKSGFIRNLRGNNRNEKIVKLFLKHLIFN